MSWMCKKCKHIGYDCVWDYEIEDEYVIYYCLEHHDIEFENESDCPYFKEFKAEPYEEKDTKCDKCRYLQDCIKRGNVINCATVMDKKSHFVCGLDSCGRK